MLIVFTLNTRVETWYSNIKTLKVGEIQSGERDEIEYWKGKHKSGSICLSHVVLYWKDKYFTLIFKHCWGYSTIF